MHQSLCKRILAGLIGGALIGAAFAPPDGVANTRGGPATLYVSGHGRAGAPCTESKPCAQIGAALKKARPRAKVIVLGGTYRETVKITSPVMLLGRNHPLIEARGLTNGILLSGPGADGSTVRGFVVKDAEMEGVLALSTSHVAIEGNVVRENDQGMHVAKPVGECAPAGPIPGDCGEGLHLMGTSHSRVVGNVVVGNAGGILLSDETGPTAHNLIARNRVLKNLFDCGITVAGHSTKAASSTGTLQPTQAGVFDNLISENVAIGNGLKGEGAGILLADGAPGSAVYNNLVKGNTANENGLAGVTLHAHGPGILNGNRIVDNRLRKDALAGNKGKPGDFEAGVSATVGILVFSAAVPLKGIVITGNELSDVHYGIWEHNAPPASAKANHFTGVAVKVEAGSTVTNLY